MAAITATKTKVTQLATKVIAFFTATLTSASDTITLTQASHGLSTIDYVDIVLEGGADANLSAGLQVSFSGLVITIVSKNAAGSDATDWTGATIRGMAVGDA